ncbi:MAG: iron-sulfur cluster assembly scaffold protein [Alphaproteobacteria bacterium]|nr:iron-sulfur cluster assembly scaffold protein [Alphaproteobacteria bacterium]
MSDDIYQMDLLRLAGDAHGHGRLASPTASVTVDNPLCGDRVTLDLEMTDGKVSAIGHEVKACLLCQASASLLGRHAPGRTVAELHEAAARVAAMLRQPDATELPPGWSGIESLKPAARIRSRHACVLLPFRALTEALEKAARKE